MERRRCRQLPRRAARLAQVYQSRRPPSRRCSRGRCRALQIGTDLRPWNPAARVSPEPGSVSSRPGSGASLPRGTPGCPPSAVPSSSNTSCSGTRSESLRCPLNRVNITLFLGQMQVIPEPLRVLLLLIAPALLPLVVRGWRRWRVRGGRSRCARNRTFGLDSRPASLARSRTACERSAMLATTDARTPEPVEGR